MSSTKVSPGQTGVATGFELGLNYEVSYWSFLAFLIPAFRHPRPAESVSLHHFHLWGDTFTG